MDTIVFGLILLVIIIALLIVLINVASKTILGKKKGDIVETIRKEIMELIYKIYPDTTTYRADPLFNSLVRYFKSNYLSSLILKHLSRVVTPLTLEEIKESIDKEIGKNLDQSTYWKVITVLCNANFICVRELKYEITEVGKELLMLKPK